LLLVTLLREYKIYFVVAHAGVIWLEMKPIFKQKSFRKFPTGS